jgi:hypothetical protein
MIRYTIVGVVLLGILTDTARADLFQKSPASFVSPDGSFSARLAPQWGVRELKQKNEIQFSIPGPGRPLLFVRRLRVPAGADPMQLVLRSLETGVGRLPHFRLVSKKRSQLSSHKAATLTGSYAFQGNLQYLRIVEEVYTVVGEEAFILRFECGKSYVSKHIRALTQFYQSFSPRAADPSDIFAEDKANKLPEVEKVPF